MRVCSSDVSVVLVALVGLAAFVVAAASHGGVFYVGDQDGWVGNPAESYGRWAARHRFKVTDTLVFKYMKGADSVLAVDKRHYDACDVRDPIGKRSDGDSAYVLATAGAFYFISGDVGRCKKGQKLTVVVVAAETAEPPAGSQAPSPSPALVPSTSIAASPDYYTTQPSLGSPSFKGLPLSPALSPTDPPLPYPHAPPPNAPSLVPIPSNYTSLLPSPTHKSSLPPSPSHLPHEHSMPALIPPTLSPKPQPRTFLRSPSPTSTMASSPVSRLGTKTSLSPSPFLLPNRQLHAPPPTISPTHTLNSQKNSSTKSSIAASPKMQPPVATLTHPSPSFVPRPQPLKQQNTRVAPAPAPLQKYPPPSTPEPKSIITAPPIHSPSSSHPPSSPSKQKNYRLALAPAHIHQPSMAPELQSYTMAPAGTPSSVLPKLPTPNPKTPRVAPTPRSSQTHPPSPALKPKSPTIAPTHSPSSFLPPSSPLKSQTPRVAPLPGPHTRPSPSPEQHPHNIAPIHPLPNSYPPSSPPNPQPIKAAPAHSPSSFPSSLASKPQKARIAPVPMPSHTHPPSPSLKLQLKPSHAPSPTLYAPLPPHTNAKVSPIYSPTFPPTTSEVSPSPSTHSSKDSPSSIHAYPPSSPRISHPPSPSTSKPAPMHRPSQAHMHLLHPPSPSPSVVLLYSPSPQPSLAPSQSSIQYPSIPSLDADSPISLSPDQQLPPSSLVPNLAPRPSHDHPISASSMHTSMSILVPSILVLILTYILL